MLVTLSLSVLQPMCCIRNETLLLCDLQELALGNNEFTGSLPYSINIAQDLRQLDLSNNKLTGPLPYMLTQIRMTVCLGVSPASFVAKALQHVAVVKKVNCASVLHSITANQKCTKCTVLCITDIAACTVNSASGETCQFWLI